MKNLLYLSLLIISVYSCKKDPATGGTTPTDNCIAGPGGQITIVAFPQHHGKEIVSRDSYLDSAFVKYNTQDLPGTKPGDFDTVIVGEAGENHVHLEGFKCGKYYIYMAGFDTTINQRVVGGIPIDVTQTSGEKIVNVPVTE